MRVTPWFAGDVSPKHPGIYQTAYRDGTVVWRRWQGCWFSGSCWYKEARDDLYPVPSEKARSFLIVKWRGVERGPR
jgi:hypothetical protein